MAFSSLHSGSNRSLGLTACLMLALASVAAPSLAHADHHAAAMKAATMVAERPGWVVIETEHSFDDLVTRVQDAVKANEMGLVTQASASVGAANRGVEIPGNRVIGVYRNDFAVRMLEASVAAGIEAPIRIYITENQDGSSGSTLSYKTPSSVFSAYVQDPGATDLAVMASELDRIFAAIAADAIK